MRIKALFLFLFVLPFYAFADEVIYHSMCYDEFPENASKDEILNIATASYGECTVTAKADGTYWIVITRLKETIFDGPAVNAEILERIYIRFRLPDFNIETYIYFTPEHIYIENDRGEMWFSVMSNEYETLYNYLQTKNYRKKMSPAESSSPAVGGELSLMTFIDNTFGSIPLEERNLNNIYSRLEQKGMSPAWTKGRLISVLNGPYLLFGVPVGYMYAWGEEKRLETYQYEQFLSQPAYTKEQALALTHKIVDGLIANGYTDEGDVIDAYSLYGRVLSGFGKSIQVYVRPGTRLYVVTISVRLSNKK